MRFLAHTTSRRRRTNILLLCFFFFSPPKLWSHWTDLNQTWTHIHLWLLFLKIWSELPLAFTLHGLGQKTAFWDRLRNLTEHISATEHDINNRKETYQSAGTPLHAAKFDELWCENGWKRLASFCPPPKFLHWETLPALPHGRYITISNKTDHQFNTKV